MVNKFLYVGRCTEKINVKFTIFNIKINSSPQLIKYNISNDDSNKYQ